MVAPENQDDMTGAACLFCDVCNKVIMFSEKDKLVEKNENYECKKCNSTQNDLDSQFDEEASVLSGNLVDEKSPHLKPIYNLTLLLADEEPTNNEDTPTNLIEVSLCSYGGKAEGFFPGLYPLNFTKHKKKKDQLDRYVRMMKGTNNLHLDLLLERSPDIVYNTLQNQIEFRIANGCTLIDLLNQN